MYKPVKLGLILMVGMTIYTLGYTSGYKQVKPPVINKIVKTEKYLVPQYVAMDRKALEYITSVIPEGMYKSLPPKSKKDKKPKKKKVLLAQK